MGIPVSKLFPSLYAASLRKDYRILILGLDDAGKTTLLYKLKLGDVVTTIPTIGFNVETVTYKNISFTMWDINGRDKTRPLWRHYFKDSFAIVFVVDSSDRERISELKDELRRLNNEDEINDLILLFFANKQDIPGCMTMIELYEVLELKEFEARFKRNIHIQPCSATQGDGLQEGLEWLSRQLTESHTSLFV
ncbi:Arf GTPase arf1 [Podila horticola]|nr:Arf GTPase arf1 [Podila horticola]